jgi:hypothetical protein
MSRSKLEQVLELLINEEREAAEELLHDFIVENARHIHEELLNESDEVVEEDLEDLDESEEELDESEEELEEGSLDLDDDTSDEIESDEEEIESEEFYDEDEMDDEEAVDDLEMGDEAGDDDMETRVDDLESALAELEAEFEKIMSGEEADADDADDAEAEDEDEMEESFELELDESEDEDLEEGEELDLEESDDDADDEELNEYVTPVSASAGDNGDNTASTVNANPKRPGDESSAAPIKTHDGNTSGGKGDAPKDMSTKNVNVSGNKKAPAMSKQAAKPGDNGVNTKSITS